MTNAATKTVQPRAPRGGCVDSVTGLFRRGGQFLSLHHTPADEASASRPATLVGSSRQVAWANRIRGEWLDRLDATLTTLRGRLDVAGRREAVAIRGEVRRIEGKRFRLRIETDAATIIGRHQGQGVVGMVRLAVVA